MRVVNVSAPKCHHLDLAVQLNRHGALATFFTAYPWFKLSYARLPRERVKTFPWLMVPRMALPRLGLMPAWTETNVEWWIKESLDRYVAAHMPDCDALVALAGCGRRCGTLAKQRGAKFLCDRGAAHIVYQDRMLREEFRRWGEDFPGVDTRFVAGELAEYEMADRIIVPSTFAERSYLDMGIPAERLIRIPYGVDLSRFAPVDEPTRDSFEMLFVGSVGFQKGFPYLLQAFERVRHPRKRLTIVGMLRPEGRRYLAKHGLPDGARLLGHVPQQQLKSIMSCSHVTILPSVQDGFGMVMAEALASGCPVVASTHTGAADLFTDGVEGFIVPPRDPVRLAESLQTLADDPDCQREMRRRARARAVTLAGWNEYGDKVVAALRTLVEPRVVSSLPTAPGVQ